MRSVSKARSPESELTSACSVFSGTKGEVWPSAATAASPPSALQRSVRMIFSVKGARTLSQGTRAPSVESQDQQRAVVLGRAGTRVGRDGREQRVAQRRGGLRRVSAEDRLETLESEGLVRGVGRLDEAVRGEDQAVALAKALGARVEGAPGEEAEGEGGERQRLDGALRDPIRGELAGVRQHALSRPDVVREDGEGHVTAGIRRAVDELVQAPEELAALVAGLDERRETGLGHRDEETRRQAVAGDVAEREGQAAVGHRQVVVVVAPDLRDRREVGEHGDALEARLRRRQELLLDRAGDR